MTAWRRRFEPGRIPKKGDVAYLGNLKFTVERVRKHRIETVIPPVPA